MAKRKKSKDPEFEDPEKTRERFRKAARAKKAKAARDKAKAERGAKSSALKTARAAKASRLAAKRAQPYRKTIYKKTATRDGLNKYHACCRANKCGVGKGYHQYHKYVPKARGRPKGAKNKPTTQKAVNKLLSKTKKASPSYATKTETLKHQRRLKASAAYRARSKNGMTAYEKEVEDNKEKRRQAANKAYHSKKGAKSKTHTGDQDYTTKQGDKVFHQGGKNVILKRKPYANLPKGSHIPYVYNATNHKLQYKASVKKSLKNKGKWVHKGQTYGRFDLAKMKGELKRKYK